MSCPVGLDLERVGEWWSNLILRDATHGITQVDGQAGLLERRRYSERPPRNEYAPTEAGRAFLRELVALGAQKPPGNEQGEAAETRIRAQNHCAASARTIRSAPAVGTPSG